MTVSSQLFSPPPITHPISPKTLAFPPRSSAHTVKTSVLIMSELRVRVKGSGNHRGCLLPPESQPPLPPLHFPGCSGSHLPWPEDKMFNRQSYVLEHQLCRKTARGQILAPHRWPRDLRRSLHFSEDSKKIGGCQGMGEGRDE